jgi:hypothetical protein
MEKASPIACAPVVQAVLAQWLGPRSPCRIDRWPAGMLPKIDGTTATQDGTAAQCGVVAGLALRLRLRLQCLAGRGWGWGGGGGARTEWRDFPV